MAPNFRSPRAFIESGTMTIPELCDWNAAENSDYPFFRFHDGHSVKSLTHAEARRGVLRVAHYVQSFAGKAERVPVAIIANTDSITYAITSIGILRAGHILFPISIRNGLAAVADLMRRTECAHILVSEDDHTSTLAKDAARVVPGITLHTLINYSELFAEDVSFNVIGTEDVPVQYNVDDVALILHSSGSTNHPRPIYWTHKRMVSRGTTPWFGEVDLTGSIIACAGTPMFHAHGVSLYWTALTTGVILGVFQPCFPPTFPTPENVFEGAVTTSADYIVTVPPFVEQWARDPVKVEHMKHVKGVMFGGAELSKEVGDELASQGISLIIIYGCTEVGAVANIIPANPGKDWAYFSITPWIQTILEDAGDGKYEIIILSPPECPLALVNTQVNGIDAFATNDLVIPHPTRQGLWKMHGRRDDQLVLTNGEKTNPLPLERIINGDPRIQDCLVFGNGRSQNGVLVFPVPEYAFDTLDQKLLAEFRNDIWKTVESANTFAPQHSRIFKEMILVTSPSKPFDYNVKGNVRRNPILQRYAQEIDDLYAEVHRSAQSDIPAPLSWDAYSTRVFVRAVMTKLLQHPVVDDADVFRNGCDSLQATWIRNTVLRALREISPSVADKLPMDVVFKAPSILALTNAILRCLSDQDGPFTTATTVEELLQRAEALASNLLPRPTRVREREDGLKDVVLITGTTGGFGCDVLEHLLRDDEIGTVYAFNRRDGRAAVKQLARFRERGLEEHLLSSPKLRMIEADLDVPGFGIQTDQLDEIRDSITHIMHNAWKVDFNLSLSSFDVDLKTVHNLIELSLSSPYMDPPIFQFVSSVGVFRGFATKTPIPEIPIGPSSALGTGYSEAKWIAERTLYNAAAQAGLPIVVVRLGQVCGDRKGHWNEKEWFPALVKSGFFTHCLPNLEALVSFIPSYPAARAFVEMRKSPHDSPILHLVHPRPVPWRAIMSLLAQELAIPLVSYSEWVAALERCGRESNSDIDIDAVDAMRRNPALSLLGFFRSWRTQGPVSTLPLSTKKATSVSGTLSGMTVLGEEEARSWMLAWRGSGFL